MMALPPLDQPFGCACGTTHRIPIAAMTIGEEAVDALGQFLHQAGATRILVIDDANTGPLLGDAVRRVITEAGPGAAELRYPATAHLRADDAALARAREAVTAARADWVVAVGSGTLTDIARWASFEAGLPFVVMATAPSVDGFASTVAALQIGGIKITRAAQAPRAIFARPSVLAAAPWPLIQSGFGDLAGKVTALMDWKLAVRLYHEAWCDSAYRVVAEVLETLPEQAQALRSRDAGAAAALFSGLIRSGLAMAMVGSSRPASGSEHHLSHYWDYLTYRGRRGYVGHGIQVGYATDWILRLYETLADLGPLVSPPLPVLDRAWRTSAEMRWGTGVGDIIEAQEEKLRWLEARWDPARWEGITGGDLVEALRPQYDQGSAMRAALGEMDLTGDPAAFQLSPALIHEAIAHANEVRARYTILDFLAGQGILARCIEHIVPAGSGRGGTPHV